MAGSFAERISQLQAAVGTGPLEIRVTYSQVYAVVMHEGHWVNYRGWGSPPEGSGFKAIEHYHGGGSHYLRNGLFNTYMLACQRWADHVLDGDPGSLVRASADGGGAICTASSALAPIEFGDLRESDHLQVFDDGALVFDRPAPVGRLSPDELKAKAAARSPRRGGTGERTYLPRTNPRHGLAHPYNGGPHLPKPAPTVDRRSTAAHEGWETTHQNFQDRRLPFRFGQHRDTRYDRDDPGSWGGTSMAEDDRHRRHSRRRRDDNPEVF